MKVFNCNSGRGHLSNISKLLKWNPIEQIFYLIIFIGLVGLKYINFFFAGLSVY